MSQLLGTSLPKTNSRNAVADLAVKVPEVTAAFWVIKILSTAMGEALSDFLDGGRGIVFPALGVLVALVAFVVALRRQFRAPRYQAGTYWFAVAMVATFGTMAADAFHQALAFPYWMTTLLYVVILAGIFVRWYSTEGTLSIHSINTTRRERYYWATVLATFALGTATGDMTATDFHWGFLASGIVFAVVIMLPALGYWKLRLNPVFAFWFAYVITRPLGASFADWLDVSTRRGGVGIGTAPVSAVLVLTIVAAVAWVARRGKDTRRRDVTIARTHHSPLVQGFIVDAEM